jgi:hypothetical protein
VNFGAVTSELEKIRAKMEELSRQDPSLAEEETRGLRQRMDELLYREEMMWLQRSLIAWLKEGDRNIKYFHRKVAGRAKKNTIKPMKKHDGQVNRDKKEMESLTTNFFKELYTADPAVQPNQVIDLFQPLITEEMNVDLCKEFSDEEISNALFQIGPLKALGSDGFPAHFFQWNWEVLKADVMTAVRSFFSNRENA